MGALFQEIIDENKAQFKQLHGVPFDSLDVDNPDRISKEMRGLAKEIVDLEIGARQVEIMSQISKDMPGNN